MIDNPSLPLVLALISKGGGEVTDENNLWQRHLYQVDKNPMRKQFIDVIFGNAELYMPNLNFWNSNLT